MLRRVCTGARAAPTHARHVHRVAIRARSTNPSASKSDLSAQLQPIRAYALNDDTGGQLQAEVLASRGSSVFTVSLKKPLGLVLAERGGRVVVESINAGGHAAAAGVAAGDVLLATTARAQVDSSKAALRGQLVLLSTAGEAFATVAAAIRSNTCSQCSVQLVLERPRGEGAAAAS